MSLTAPSLCPDRATTIHSIVEAPAVSPAAHDGEDPIEGIVTHAFTAETVDACGEEIQLRFRGELDVAIAREVRNFLKRKIHRDNDITIDLTGLTFLDTVGLGSLLEPINLARDHGRTITLTGPLQPQVERLLQLTGTGSLTAHDAQ